MARRSIEAFASPRVKKLCGHGARSGTPHPTSLRSATFSHKGHEGEGEALRMRLGQSLNSNEWRGGWSGTFLLPLWEKVAERSEVG